MRLRLLFAALLMQLPIPALADVTARYSVDGGAVTVESARAAGGSGTCSR